MALTEKEILSNAGEMVTGLVTSLSGKDLSLQQQQDTLLDAQRIHLAAAKIIEVMVEGNMSTRWQTKH